MALLYRTRLRRRASLPTWRCRASRRLWLVHALQGLSHPKPYNTGGSVALPSGDPASCFRGPTCFSAVAEWTVFCVAARAARQRLREPCDSPIACRSSEWESDRGKNSSIPSRLGQLRPKCHFAPVSVLDAAMLTCRARSMPSLTQVLRNYSV